MRLFLVRHGETVDNVAGIYAGIRDSPLTAHGVLQARRLAAHLAALGPVKAVFSSDLRRAADTAKAVVDAAQPSTDAGSDDHDHIPDGAQSKLQLIQLPELRERDFGSAEGKKFGPGVVAADAETREQMRLRAETFVRGHLEPLLVNPDEAAGSVVVVAHGLILNSLLRVLLARFRPGETAALGNSRTAAWSNTGYVELVVGLRPLKSAVADGAGDGVSGEESGERTPATTSPSPSAQQITLSVVGVNVLKHLEGLKKTRGGIGSAQFDKRQRTMDSFFGPAAKKARVEKEPAEG